MMKATIYKIWKHKVFAVSLAAGMAAGWMVGLDWALIPVYTLTFLAGYGGAQIDDDLEMLRRAS